MVDSAEFEAVELDAVKLEAVEFGAVELEAVELAGALVGAELEAGIAERAHLARPVVELMDYYLSADSVAPECLDLARSGTPGLD